MARVLIPETLSGNVIAAIRSLTRQGDRCEAAWSEFIFKSRYVNEYHKITSSVVDDLEYVQDILRLCKEKEYDILLPFGNTSYFAFSKHHESISGNARFMVTDYETFKIAHDKYRTAKFCDLIGVKTPRIFTEYSHNDVVSLSKELRYPVVIKAKSGTGVHLGLRYANNGEELLRYYDEISSFRSDTGASNFEDPLIEEFIPGFIHDACALSCNGKVVNVLTQRREMMYPIYGGVGAVNVTTHNPEVSRLARTLLEALNWHGPAQIEFKFDERDRTYKLIEMNPKLWGTLL